MQTEEKQFTMAHEVAFAETHWSVILQAQGPASSVSSDALENLCRAYWYPLYGYVRRCGHDTATAQDLTQEFFVRLIENNSLQSVHPSKGKFRSFLLASLKHFLSNERARATACKRGGRCAFFSLDETYADERLGLELAREAPADQVFDRAWALTVLENALAHLKTEYTRAGKEQLLEVLQPHLAPREGTATYSHIASDLAMSEAAVKMAIVRLRRRFGQLLRAQVARTVLDPAELDEELRYLFSVLTR